MNKLRTAPPGTGRLLFGGHIIIGPVPARQRSSGFLPTGYGMLRANVIKDQGLRQRLLADSEIEECYSDTIDIGMLIWHKRTTLAAGPTRRERTLAEDRQVRPAQNIPSDDMLAAGDGHDFPRLVDESGPGVTAVLDDVVEGQDAV
jgi:hypothetical protein